MTDLVIVPADVAVVKTDDMGKITAPTATAITAGAYCYLNSSGYWELARGTTQALAGGATGITGVAIDNTNHAGDTLTCVIDGLVDLGPALDALAEGASVYLSDTATGIMADAAGTKAKLIGNVYLNYGATTSQRLLMVIPHTAAAA